MDLAPDAVVLDSYHAPPSVSSTLRAAGTPLLTIVDGAARGQSGDLYVDQNLDSENQPGPTDAPRLAGLPYALLRGEVLRLRPAAPPTGTRQDPPKVLAYFGGTDAYGASPVLAAALIASGAAFDATIVAPRPELRASIESLRLRPGQRISAIEPTEELMTIAVGSDVVISASGTSLWELLCIGAATAIIWVVDNQELGYGRVLAADLAAGLGHLDDVRDNPSRRRGDAGPAAARRGLARPAALDRLGPGGRPRADARGVRPDRDDQSLDEVPGQRRAARDVGDERAAQHGGQHVRREATGRADRADVLRGDRGRRPERPATTYSDRRNRRPSFSCAVGPTVARAQRAATRSRSPGAARSARPAPARTRSRRRRRRGESVTCFSISVAPSATAATAAPMPSVWSDRPTWTSNALGEHRRCGAGCSPRPVAG